MHRRLLIVEPAFLRDPVLRHARFTILLKDGSVVQGRVGQSTALWFGYYLNDFDNEPAQRISFDDIDTAEIG